MLFKVLGCFDAQLITFMDVHTACEPHCIGTSTLTVHHAVCIVHIYGLFFQ